jgi:hypothetical protein
MFNVPLFVAALFLFSNSKFKNMAPIAYLFIICLCGYIIVKVVRDSSISPFRKPLLIINKFGLETVAWKILWKDVGAVSKVVEGHVNTPLTIFITIKRNDNYGVHGYINKDYKDDHAYFGVDEMDRKPYLRIITHKNYLYFVTPSTENILSYIEAYRKNAANVSHKEGA